MVAPVPEYTLTLIKKTIIARDVVEFRFAKPAGFTFKAGQFLQFKIPTETGVVLRSYSIASAPEDEYIEICLKVLPNGKASVFLSALEVGESAMVQGPEGHFVCKDEHSPHKIFIATGTGLAPIMSMVPDQLARPQENSQVHVLFGVRNEADLFWVERLDAFQKKYSHFSHNVTLSQPDQPTGWQGLVGRVTAHVPQHHLEAEYYLCGSLEMVKDVRKILVDKGVPTKHIHFEIF